MVWLRRSLHARVALALLTLCLAEMDLARAQGTGPTAESSPALEASWVAMREIRDQVRKSGAGRDSVHDFRQTFGSFEAWEALRDALRQKMSDCADELKIARRTRAEEIRLVHEREEQGVAVELGESGFGPRVTAPAPRR